MREEYEEDTSIVSLEELPEGGFKVHNKRWREMPGTFPESFLGGILSAEVITALRKEATDSTVRELGQMLNHRGSPSSC